MQNKDPNSSSLHTWFFNSIVCPSQEHFMHILYDIYIWHVDTVVQKGTNILVAMSCDKVVAIATVKGA
jgi:hypothetical protein